MSKLLTFYKTLMRIIVVLLAILGITIGRNVIPLIESTFPDSPYFGIFIKIITSSAFFGLLYFIGEWLVNKHLWKFLFFHRDIDFSGTWLGWSFYTHVEIESNEMKKADFKPFFAEHEVIIEQNCFEIKIESSAGKSYVHWESLAMTITEAKMLKFAYEVSYQGDDRLKDDVIGYEEMKILQRLGNIDKLPILLSGTFYHCATGKTPIYKGRTIFVRESYCHLIDKNRIPDFAKDIVGKINTPNGK